MENYKQWMEQKLTSEDMEKLPKVVKPLNDDEISKILDAHGFDEVQIAGEYIDIVKLIRDVEKAHGIV
jgi:hypothetical protein